MGRTLRLFEKWFNEQIYIGLIKDKFGEFCR